MSRRVLTLSLAGALALALVLVAVVARVPYVALGPGPVYDTLGEVQGRAVLQVSGREVFPTDGRLDLTTVGVNPELTLLQAIRGWFDRDLAVVPREVVYPPDRTDEQVQQENAQAMVESQSAALLAAATQLGIEVSRQVEVSEVAEDGPSQGVLQPQDVLVAVDGTPVSGSDALREAIGRRAPGGPVEVVFRRGTAERTATITTAAVDGRAAIGVVIAEVPADLPFDVDITLEDVGGPSAGLMFALGILDKLGEESLTGGAHVAGTGSITPDGTVGAIGGIPQKLQAARAEGATVFLVPEDNCAEAVRRPPPGLALVRVSSLSDALEELEDVRSGAQPELCPT